MMNLGQVCSFSLVIAMSFLSTVFSQVIFCEDVETWYRNLENDYCYYISDYTTTQSAAQARCKTWGADLTTILDSQENSFLVDVMRSSVLKFYWIGLVDVDPHWRRQSWQWQDGTSPGYTNWGGYWIGRFYVSEPDRTGDCAFMTNAGEWGDYICTSNENFICKKAWTPLLPPPTNPPLTSPTLAPRPEGPGTVTESPTTTSNTSTATRPTTNFTTSPTTTTSTTSPTSPATGPTITSTQGGTTTNLTDAAQGGGQGNDQDVTIVAVSVVVPVVVVAVVVVIVLVVLDLRRKKKGRPERAIENEYSLSPPAPPTRPLPSAPSLEDIHGQPNGYRHNRHGGTDTASRDVSQDDDYQYSSVPNNSRAYDNQTYISSDDVTTTSHSTRNNVDNMVTGDVYTSVRRHNDPDELTIHDNLGYVGVME